MSASAAFTRTWPVGLYEVTLTLPPTAAGHVELDVQWSPAAPKKLNAAELQQYRAGRDAALRAWGVACGRRVAVVDL